jgi:hypothetical protein
MSLFDTKLGLVRLLRVAAFTLLLAPFVNSYGATAE